MFNHAISAEEAPGSVFKLAAGLGVLNEGVVTPDYKVNDPGKISLTEKFYPTDPGHPRDYYCWIYKTTGGGHGMVDFLHGMGESCDVYWYKVGGGYENEVPGNGLGILRLAEYAKALGYGQTTGIELPGESSGNIPDPTWKRLTQGENWSTGDTYISTIGQGYVTATALQVLMSYVTLANNGQYVKPTLIKDYLDSEGRVIKTMQPTVEWDITKDPMIAIYDENDQPTYLTDANGKTIPQLDRNGQPETDISGNQVFQVQRKTIAPWVVKLNQQAMRFVVTDGTAKDIFVGFNENGTPIDTAGKTGTAEYCDDIARAKNLCQPNNWPSHAWYVGYAPYQNPEIAVVAFVYNGQEGATVAAPIVRDVLQGYFDLKSQK
jgi:penicillin-binding protein 2